MIELVSLFRPEFVFSLAFFIGFIGFGFFFNNNFWPWLKTYLDKTQEIDAARQARYDKMLEVISEFKHELGAFRETHSIVLAYIISDFTGQNNSNDPVEVEKQKRRSKTQDLLLRRLEKDDS